jgi:hypothetical protein
LLRELNDSRAAAITARTRGDGADLSVLAAEVQLKSVQGELKRVHGSVGKGTSGGGTSGGGGSSSSHRRSSSSSSSSSSSGGGASNVSQAAGEVCRSSLVRGGAALPRADVVLQLAALEAEARGAAEGAKAAVARAEARDPKHGAEAEVSDHARGQTHDLGVGVCYGV